MYDQTTLNEMVELAQKKNGLSTAIHAIGDGTIDMALEAIEMAQKKNIRMKHLEVALYTAKSPVRIILIK